MKKKIIFGFVAIVILWAIYWLFGHSFIEITMENTGSGDLAYSILDQSSNKANQGNSTQAKIKKLVRRGRYEVLITQGSKSYFVLAEASGFLSTTKVNAKLEEEKARSFAADSPNNCMTYAAGHLFSYSCGGPFEQLKAHLPATAQTPPIARRLSTDLRWTVEGTAITGAGTVLLLRAIGHNAIDGSVHVAYLLNDTTKLIGGVGLKNLDKDSFYDIQPYRDGFIVYDKALTSVLYYPSIGAAPEKLEIAEPADSKLQPYFFTIHGDSIIAAYAEDTDTHRHDEDEPISAEEKTEVIVQKDGRTFRFSLGKQYTEMTTCGANQFCGILDGQLDVYELAAGEPSVLYSIKGSVEAMDPMGDNLLIVRNGELLNFSIESRSGTVEYRMGPYTPCGILLAPDGYSLCLVGPKDRRVALKIGREPVAGDDIDKKVARLLQMEEVKTVSAQGNFIHISPELGKVKFIPAIGGFGYEPAVKARVNATIREAIDDIGIDQNKYRIVNPFE